MHLTSRPSGHPRARILAVALLVVACALSPQLVLGQFSSYQKISENLGGFTGELDLGDDFGESVCALGDLDGDGATDIAVGAEEDDDGGPDRGAVWILFMNPVVNPDGTVTSDGTVKGQQKISSINGYPSSSSGGLPISNGARFGDKCAGLGDLNRDGVPDIAVNAQSGGVRIIFLNADGTVRSYRTLATGGSKVANIGDFDGDGVTDLVFGQSSYGGLGSSRGRIEIYLLRTTGSVKQSYAISELEGGFTGTLDDNDRFGHEVAGIGDLDGDGVLDIAVNAKGDDDGGTDTGAVWILFMNQDGTVRRHQKISNTQGGFRDKLAWYDAFGEGITGLGDVDGDGFRDIAVGADYYDEGGQARGGVWLLFLNPDGTVKNQERIASLTPGFVGALQNKDNFGNDLANLGDLNGDGVTDLLVGADSDSNETALRDSAYVFFLEDGLRTSGFDLLFSHWPDRWDAGLLHQSTVSGPIYVFVNPAQSVRQVEFYIDDVLVRTDSAAPYDLTGGSASTASPFDTATLSEGSHRFKAVSRLGNGVSRTSWAYVHVVNSLNAPPVLEAIADQRVMEGQSLTVPVIARDPDDQSGLVLTETNNLPGNPSILTDLGSGSGRIVWTPRPGDAAEDPYQVTVTATDGESSVSQTFEIAVEALPAGNELSVSIGSAAGGAFNLTAEGSADWVHWGLTSASSVNRKSGGTPKIGDLVQVKASAGRWDKAPDTRMTWVWTNGTPTSGTATRTFLQQGDSTGKTDNPTFIGRGFQFSVPADTQTRTLSVYLGGSRSVGKIQLCWGDCEVTGPAYETVVTSSSGPYDQRLNVTYRGAQAGQALTLRYLQDTASGNIILGAATLR